MRALVLLVVVAAVALAAAEMVLPARIEDEIEDRVAQQVPEAGSVEASLDSFPVVARALATGEVERLIVHLEDVARPDVTISSVDVELLGLDIARRALVDGDVDLQRVDRAELVALVTEDDLEEALPGGGVELDLSPGRAEATVAGQTVGSDVTVEGGRVHFDLGPLPGVAVGLPGREFFPCPLEGAVVEGAVRLTCVLDEVPAYLLRRIDGG